MSAQIHKESSEPAGARRRPQPQRLLLLGFPAAESEAVRALCDSPAGNRYAIFSRLSGSDLSDPDHSPYDVVALFLAGSGLDDLAYLMRLSSRCATVVVCAQSEAEVRWLRLINTVVPATEFTPDRLLAAADEAQLRRRHHHAGVVTADALHSLRAAVGAAQPKSDTGILILDEHDRVVFANPAAKSLGGDGTRALLEGLRQRGWPQLGAPEVPVPAGDQSLIVSAVTLEEHGHPVQILRIERAESGTPTEAVLHHLSLIDAQTGLPNRAQFLTRVEHALADGGAATRLALMLVQLETPALPGGEDTAVQVRRAAAERLEGCLRTDDVVARLGGDTFGILLRGFSKIEDLLRPAHKLLARVTAPYLVGKESVTLVARMGISVHPDDGISAAELLHRADRALAQARSSRTAGPEFVRSELGGKVQRRWLLESRLSSALAEQRFTVHYQPLVETATRKIVGVEALARWTDPALGPVSPGEFIPLVQELGLMNELSHQVWRQAFAQLRRWRADHDADLTLSVNVSPSQFLWPGFIRTLEQQLLEAGIPPQALELEITEGLLIEDHDLTRMVLKEARDLGVRVYLDDFGTGYSSLGYLMDLPVAGIKVDRAFCSGLPSSQNHVAMTVTILTLARHLNLDVLVEGVETELQARFLSNHRVPRLQGFLFSRPLPPDEFTLLLAEEPDA